MIPPSERMNVTGGSRPSLLSVDVLVVGLGPSGSTALRILASSGVSVLGVDRAMFPRDKPCGGGVSARTLPYLPSGLIDRLPHQPTQGISLTYRGQSERVQYFGRSIAYQVRRDQFDEALLGEAISTGASVWTGVSLGRVTRSGTLFIVKVGKTTIQARAIIAADGATSKVMRDLDPQAGRDRLAYRPWTSAEGWAKLRQPIDSSLVAIDLGSVKGGYAWSFPKKDSLWGLGVAGFLTPLVDPKSEFRKYLSSRHAELGSGGPIAWPLPNYRSVRHGRIPGLFLVGDAGGIVDPFLGEGIYYAVLSGTKAAESYLSSRAHSGENSKTQGLGSNTYSRWLDSSIWPDFRQGSRLAQAIYRFPGVFFSLTGRYPGLLDLYASILTGEHDYRSFSREIIGRAIRMILPGRRPVNGRAL